MRFANWLNHNVLEKTVRVAAATAITTAPVYAAPEMEASGFLEGSNYRTVIENISDPGQGNNMTQATTPAGLNHGVDANYCYSTIDWTPTVEPDRTVWTQGGALPLEPNQIAEFTTNYDPNCVAGEGDVTAESYANGSFNPVTVTAPRRAKQTVILWNPMGDYTVSPDTPNEVDANNPNNRIYWVPEGGNLWLTQIPHPGKNSAGWDLFTGDPNNPDVTHDANTTACIQVNGTMGARAVYTCASGMDAGILGMIAGLGGLAVIQSYKRGKDD